MNPTGTLAQRSRQILEALQDRPDGATRQDLQILAGLQDLDEQAVRRLLAHLVQRGAARVAGQTKARRYFLGQDPAAEGPTPEPEGRAGRARTAPDRHRPACGYPAPWLESYQAGGTGYLDAETRQRLAGRDAGAADRAARQRLLVDLAWDSARMEGGGYGWRECRRLLETGEADPARPLRDTQMLLNHRAAIEFMIESGPELAADPVTVRNLSALLTENLLADPADEGRLRRRALALPGTGYRPPDSPRAILDAFERILGTAAAIADPFEQSFFLLVQLVCLQPFSDGNGALARMAANIPLLARGRTPVCFMAVPAERFAQAQQALWEQNQVAPLRDLYGLAQERSCARLAAGREASGRPDPFRLRHRAEIKAAVRAVVLAREAGPEAEARIRAHARAHLPGESRIPFLAAVEAELASLHDGNFARYQLRPSEFAAYATRPRR